MAVDVGHGVAEGDDEEGVCVVGGYIACCIAGENAIHEMRYWR